MTTNMKWTWPYSDRVHLVILWTIFHLPSLKSSFFGSGCNCAPPCPPPPSCPTSSSYGPCPSYCSSNQPSYSYQSYSNSYPAAATSYQSSITPTYSYQVSNTPTYSYTPAYSYTPSNSYPAYSYQSSNYYPAYSYQSSNTYPGSSYNYGSSYPEYVTSASSYSPSSVVGGGGSYSNSVPAASPSYTSRPGYAPNYSGSSYSIPATSYALPPTNNDNSAQAYVAIPAISPYNYANSQSENSGYVYAHVNQTPNTISPYASGSYVYTYTPVPSTNNNYYQSGTATVYPKESFADATIESSTDFKAMPYVDVSYKSKELTPVDVFERRNTVLKNLRERQMRQLSAPSVETVAYEAPSVCNNDRLGKIMVKAMVADISISKRLVRSATELEFSGKKYGDNNENKQRK